MPNLRVLVLADDLTGAAEVAGAAVARGWRAEVWADSAPDSDSGAPRGDYSADPAGSELLVLNTGNRTRDSAAVGAHLTSLLRRLAPSPTAIYLKCDSLLRGHVVAELTAALLALDAPAALLVPANPARGRVIAQGNYLIDGVPLAETLLARDPTHPRSSSSVAELLGGAAHVVPAARWPAPCTGLVVPDCQSPADLRRLAATAPPGCLLAGAAEFFCALLETRWRALVPEAGGCSAWPQASQPAAEGHPRAPRLFVCGSLIAWRQGRAEQFRQAGVPVVEWAPGAVDAVERALAALGTAFLSIGDLPAGPQHTGPGLLAAFAALVAECLGKSPKVELFVEGGDTAAAVIAALGERRFSVQAELAPGVVALQPLAPAGAFSRLVVKVGSYAWPAACMP